MTADHNDSPVRPPTSGDQGSTARFEIVLRGYDRRQVEDHISALERTIAQQRNELEQARRASEASKPSAGGASDHESTSVFESSKPAPQRESSGGLNPEMISSFTSRLQSILQAAEEEADEVRSNARAFAQAEEQTARSKVEELERRRQSVLSELGRVRTQLDGLLTTAERERATVGAQSGASGPSGSPGPSGSSGSEKGPDNTDSATESVRTEVGGHRQQPQVPGRQIGGSNNPLGTPKSPTGAPSGGSSGLKGPSGPGGQQSSGQSHPGHRPQMPGRPGGPVPIRPVQQPQPSHQSQQPQGQPPQGQPPKPRPTPSPRPRPNPPTSSLPGANLPGVEMTQGPVEPTPRNGNGGRSDDDKGFGTGAR